MDLSKQYIPLFSFVMCVGATVCSGFYDFLGVGLLLTGLGLASALFSLWQTKGKELVIPTMLNQAQLTKIALAMALVAAAFSSYNAYAHLRYEQALASSAPLTKQQDATAEKPAKPELLGDLIVKALSGQD